MQTIFHDAKVENKTCISNTLVNIMAHLEKNDWLTTSLNQYLTILVTSDFESTVVPMVFAKID